MLKTPYVGNEAEGEMKTKSDPWLTLHLYRDWLNRVTAVCFLQHLPKYSRKLSRNMYFSDTQQLAWRWRKAMLIYKNPDMHKVQLNQSTEWARCFKDFNYIWVKAKFALKISEDPVQPVWFWGWFKQKSGRFSLVLYGQTFNEKQSSFWDARLHLK